MAYALLGLLLSLVLAVLTIQVARRVLLSQRQESAIRQAIANATVVRSVLTDPGTDLRQVLVSLDASTPARPLLQIGEDWYAATVEIGRDDVPESLAELLDESPAGVQRIRRSSTNYIVTGISVPAVDARYYELASLNELDRTMLALTYTLAAAAAITSLAAAATGWWASGRVIRPLGDVAGAARSISQGDLNTRLPTTDRELTPLTSAFNDMAEALQHRIERETRFTSDVSHELRNPLTAITAAVNLAQRTDDPERMKMALGMVDSRVDHLRRLVLDLLEISRFDAGATELDLQPTDLRMLLDEVADHHQLPAEVIRCELPASTLVLLDRRRVERVLTNLIVNATNYADGPTLVAARVAGESIELVVEDCGPGVAPDEREAIFGRFHRGRAANVPDRPSGTGLGLALVEEHVRFHGGQIRVEDSACGGARFVVELPRRTP